MSNIEQYPKNQYYLVARGSATELGSYGLTTDGDLTLTQLRVFHKCTTSYLYQLRLVVAMRAGGAAVVASDYVKFSNETTGQVGGNWMGDVVFDFPEYKLLQGEEYYVRLESVGYSRPTRPLQNTAYLAVWADWMQPVGTTDKAGARIAFGVKK